MVARMLHHQLMLLCNGFPLSFHLRRDYTLIDKKTGPKGPVIIQLTLTNTKYLVAYIGAGKPVTRAERHFRGKRVHRWILKIVVAASQRKRRDAKKQ